MDITEAQAAKRTLEQTLLLAISQFEDASDTSVECVRLEHFGHCMGSPETRCRVAKVTVEAHL